MKGVTCHRMNGKTVSHVILAPTPKMEYIVCHPTKRMASMVSLMHSKAEDPSPCPGDNVLPSYQDNIQRGSKHIHSFALSGMCGQLFRNPDCKGLFSDLRCLINHLLEQSVNHNIELFPMQSGLTVELQQALCTFSLQSHKCTCLNCQSIALFALHIYSHMGDYLYDIGEYKIGKSFWHKCQDKASSGLTFECLLGSNFLDPAVKHPVVQSENAVLALHFAIPLIQLLTNCFADPNAFPNFWQTMAYHVSIRCGKEKESYYNFIRLLFKINSTPVSVMNNVWSVPPCTSCLNLFFQAQNGDLCWHTDIQPELPSLTEYLPIFSTLALVTFGYIILEKSHTYLVEKNDTNLSRDLKIRMKAFLGDDIDLHGRKSFFFGLFPHGILVNSIDQHLNNTRKSTRSLTSIMFRLDLLERRFFNNAELETRGLNNNPSHSFNDNDEVIITNLLARLDSIESICHDMGGSYEYCGPEYGHQPLLNKTTIELIGNLDQIESIRPGETSSRP